MSSTEAGRQFDNILPPVTAQVVAIAVDATSRPYDLSTIEFPDAFRLGGHSYLSLYADGGDIYFAFGAATLTVDDTAVVSAGGTLAKTASAAMVLPAGVPMSLRVSRDTLTDHRWIAVKCASGKTATLRMYVSSPSNHQ